MKVVFCTSEAAPYAKTGGMADVCGSLPFALAKEGLDVSVVTPFYRTTQQMQLPFKALNKDTLALHENGVDFYFIKNEGYFNRDGLYGTPSGDYADNLERFSFFNQRIFQLLKDIKCSPDILHCHDWPTSLAPLYLKSHYRDDPFFQKTKTVLTIHNLAYQGVFTRHKFAALGLPAYLNAMQGLEYYGQMSLLKGGILFSDWITTVSPQYAKEIQSPEGGRGLEGVMRLRAKETIGILNGIDANYWNPEQDPLITQAYHSFDLEGKAKNKRALQEQSGLRISEETPLFGFVGRLSEQKGLDIVAQAIEELMNYDVQFVFQGVGEERYEWVLRNFQRRFPQKIAAHIKFDEPLAHQIYAGSDIFLMPSTYEPCGLSQMISFRYGTMPLVHHTGGLIDTVMPFHIASAQGDGFVFTRFEKSAFLKSFELGLRTFQEKNLFQEVCKRIMKYDFSWTTSAMEYKKLYQKCIS
jgi:starch synthase